jgi:GntR family transcriptional regulator
MFTSSSWDVQQPDVQVEVDQDTFLAEGPVAPRETLVTHISKRMLEMIRSGRLPVGARLPSEPKLAQMFQVSRNTLRESIRLLIAHGVLETRKGVGTFVRGTGFSSWPVDTGIEELSSTTEIISSAGLEPGCRSYELAVAAGEPRVTAALALEKGEEVYRLTRVRLADGRPVIVCRDYLPLSLVPSEEMRSFDGSGSLFAFLRGRNLSIAVAEAVIKPLLPPAEVADALEVAGTEPLLLLEQTHFDGLNRPLLYSDNYINTSFIGYHVRRMPPSFFAAHPGNQLA